jgi:hypothetical protein
MAIYKIPTGLVPEAPNAVNYVANKGVVFFDSTGVLRLGDGRTPGGAILTGGSSGTGAISVKSKSASSGIISNTVTNVTSLNFDTDSGFAVTDLGNGAVLVAMNSTFKYWQVDGQPGLTAEGLDTVNFIPGPGISIVATTSGTNKSIKFISSSTTIATKNSLGGIIIGDNLTITTSGVLSAVIGNIDGGVPNSVYGGLTAIDGGGI